MNGQPVEYRITEVTPDQQFPSTGGVIAGKRVTFTTNTGYTGSVFAPNTVMGDPAAVRTLVEGEIRQVTAVQALTGTIPG